MSQESPPVDTPFAALYHELRRLAHLQMRRSGGTPTLDTTAVVHETYLKLVAGDPRWSDRRHFLALAARAMRQVVIDYVRAQRAEKRGGAFERVEISTGLEQAPVPLDELLAIDRGLAALEAADERLARLVELRFFAGLDGSELAELLGVSERTVDRDWRRARAFLLRQLAPEAS